MKYSKIIIKNTQNYNLGNILDPCSIHKDKKNNTIITIVDSNTINKLNKKKIKYDIIENDMEQFYKKRLLRGNKLLKNKKLYNKRGINLPTGSMGGYYTYSEINNQLDELYNLNTAIISVKQSIGKSLEGRDIWSIKVGHSVFSKDKPEVLYTGLHHAREPMSYMNLFYYIRWLIQNYNPDGNTEDEKMATHILHNRQLWFVPCINPDGLVYNESIAPNGGGLHRKNRRQICGSGTNSGVDLNRNYGYAWNCQGNYKGSSCDSNGSSGNTCDQTYRGTSAFSEQCTSAIRDFVIEHNFKTAFNYHSYSNLLIYPFGYSNNNSIDQTDLDIFIEYGTEMVSVNNYVLGSGPEILYAVNGEACDWMYGEHHIFAYTPEVGSFSDGFWPLQSRIIPLCEENLYANQYLAMVAGSKYDVSINITNNELVIEINNIGLGDANINIDLSSDNIQFENNNYVHIINARSSDTITIPIYIPVNGGIIDVSINCEDNITYSESIQIDSNYYFSESIT